MHNRANIFRPLAEPLAGAVNLVAAGVGDTFHVVFEVDRDLLRRLKAFARQHLDEFRIPLVGQRLHLLGIVLHAGRFADVDGDDQGGFRRGLRGGVGGGLGGGLMIVGGR